MSKIPVERTIGDTYRFAFTNILSIFGIAWLPCVIMAALVGATVWWMWPDLAAIDYSAQPDLVRNQEIGMRLVAKMLTVVFPLYLLIYVFYAMVITGVQRKALGLIEGPVFVYFSLGSEVWRLLGAMILAFIIICIGGALAAIGVAVIFWIGRLDGVAAIYGLVEFIAVVAGVCWFYYLAVRLTFFLPPVVVAEGGFGLGRSWALGGGNFWRIVVLFLACVFGPMIVISMVSNIVFMPFMMGAMVKLQQAAEAHQVLPPDQVFAMVLEPLRRMWPYWLAYELITMPILLGLTNAISALAYRNVTAAPQEANA
jgi:hypothetical protein